jgi:hypothetical protein
MEEIMVRIHSAQTLIRTPLSLSPVLVREYVYLQLRICCELVALACLVCHNDIKAAQTKRIEKAYIPEDILRKLGELHPDFYPVPVTTEVSEQGVHLDYLAKPFFTKEELIELWNKSGDFLHKGSLRQLIGGRQNHRTQIMLDDMMEKLQNMVNLVNTHRISRIGNLFHFIITMDINGWADPTTTITVNVAIAESPDLKGSNDGTLLA